MRPYTAPGVTALDEATARKKLLELADDRPAAALAVAVRLGLFTALAAGRRTANELARDTGAGETALEVLADALVAIGLLTKDAGRYANAELAAAYLVRGGAPYLGGLLAAGRLTGTAGRLWRAVRGGGQRSPRGPAALPRALSRALYRDALVCGPRLARAVDLSGRRRLLDVGGGLGGYAAAFCEAYPALRATVFDLPRVAAEGRRLAATTPIADRLGFVEGDFLRDRLPGGSDVVLASDILHGQRPDDARRLVRALYDALAPGGLLVLRDVLMDAKRTAPRWAALFSLTLLTASSSRCYAEDEVREWLADAGFRDVRGVVVETEPWDPNRVLLASRA